MNALTKITVAAVLLALAIPGCAAHRVKINAYLSREFSFPEPRSDASVSIVVGSEPHEPLLEAEVARKIEYLLRRGGYDVVEQDQSQYVLTSWLSIDRGTTETDVYPVYDGGGFATASIYSHHGWISATTHVPGRTSYVPYTYTYFTRQLSLTLYQRGRWESAEDDELGPAAIWRCSANSTGKSTDLRSVANYLLAAAFEYFGQDSGQEVRVRFARGDQRIRTIHAAGR